MSTVRAKATETMPIKKTLKKKVVDKSSDDKVEKIKKSDAKVSTDAKPKKESVKKETVKKESDDEVVEKIPKKINVKATLADICGLNLSVAKIKNIISSLCINKETFTALKEMKEHRVITSVTDVDEKKVEEFTFSLEGLSQETLAYLDMCSVSLNENKGLLYSRKVTRDMSKEDAARYNEAKRIAVSAFQAEQKNGHLFQQFEFNLTAFNLKYDSKFYDAMPDYEAGWKTLVNKELYTHCVNLVNKNKVRFNSESKIFITAFVEFIVKQLVVHGTKSCIADKKKIIQLSHALDAPSAEFTMFPFISSTSAYKKYVSQQVVDAESETDDETEVEPTESEDDVSDRKLQFRYYVAELCRNVRMELSAQDETPDLESKFNQTSVSRLFKQFCSNVIIELLQTFGNILKVEVTSRGVKTVNYSTIGALLQTAHILHNIEFAPTIEFIQEKYNVYNQFLADRSLKREETPVAPKVETVVC
jgi:hypothetical protein